MGDTLDILNKLALQIRNASDEGENTAERVGRTLIGILEQLSLIEIEGLKKLFLSRQNDDEASGLIKFLQGIISLGDIVAKQGITVGENGSGITVLENGMTQAVVDYLYVKVKAIFDELEVKKKTYVGGEQILSPAGMKCIRVEELDEVYRCYLKVEEDGIEIENQFTPGTQAICQECNIKVGISQHAGNRYYWRLVTAVGVDYIDLSKTKRDLNIENDIPAAGDDIVGLGHQTDITRQGAIIMSSVNEVSPSILMYQGIDSFSLVGKGVTGFDFDKTTGKARMRVYGEAYIGEKDRSSYMEFIPGKGFRVKAQVDILPGSTGFENVRGLEFGKVNLLRNSGFTGDYNSAKLEENTELETETDLYSQALKFWAATNAVVNVDSVSQSGRSVTLNTGILVQTLYYKMISGEKYIISFRARGASVSVSCAGLEKTEQLTSDYQQFIYKFEATSDTEFTISGSCTVCEIQLERGTVPSEWSMSPLDNNSAEAKFEALKYLTDVIREGSTTFIGGLGLLSMILVGNYVDGKMKQVTGGLSGVYNDGDDPLLWGDGDLEKAIRTVMACKDNPMAFLDMTEEELADYAKIVLTHGGRAILNDVILRGYVYALGGVFKGTVYAEDGEFNGKISLAGGKIILNKDGSGKLANGNIEWDADGNPTVRGKYESKIAGAKIVIDPGERLYDWPTITLYDKNDHLTMTIIGSSGLEFGDDPKVVMSDPDNTSNYAEYRRSSMVINEETVNGNFQTFMQAGRIYIAKNGAVVWDINKL